MGSHKTWAFISGFFHWASRFQRSSTLSFFKTEEYYTILLNAHKNPMRKKLSLSCPVFRQGNCSPERSSTLPRTARRREDLRLNPEVWLPGLPMDYVHCLNEWMVNLHQAPRWTGQNRGPDFTEFEQSHDQDSDVTTSYSAGVHFRCSCGTRGTFSFWVESDKTGTVDLAEVRPWRWGWTEGGDTNSAAFPHRRIHKCQCSSRSIY